MEAEEENYSIKVVNENGDRVCNEDVRLIRRTRNKARRFSPPVPPQKELGKEKGSTRSYEKTIYQSPSPAPTPSGRRTLLCSSINLISPPDSQVASESCADPLSDNGNLVGLHDVTNSIILFSLPVSQLTKGERVGNVDVRQTRKIRNQIRRYSPPLAPQNDSKRKKRCTRSHEKSVTPSPCHTPIIPSPCQTPNPSARSTRLSNSSDRVNTGSLHQEMDYSSGTQNISISSSLHVDNEAVNGSIDDGESICPGDSESELLDDNERWMNQGKKQASRRRSSLLTDGDSDTELRNKRREKCREYQRRRRAAAKKAKACLPS